MNLNPLGIDFNEPSHTYLALAIGMLVLLSATLCYSTWKAIATNGREGRSKYARVYWWVVAPLGWAGMLGMMVFNSLPAWVDGNGILHEQFSVMAISMLALSLCLIGTIAGLLWSAARLILTNQQPSRALEP